MLEEIKKLIGSMFVNRFEKSEKWNGRLVPYVHKKLIVIEMESRNYTHLVHSGQGEFDVTEGHTNSQWGYKTCSVILENGNSLASLANMLQGALSGWNNSWKIMLKTSSLWRNIKISTTKLFILLQLHKSGRRGICLIETHLMPKGKIGRALEHKRRESLNTALPES